MILRRTYFFLFLTMALLLPLGCSGGTDPTKGRSTIKGKVTYKNKPVTGGKITLFLGEKETPIPGTLSPEGDYKFSNIPEGKYKVCISTADVPDESKMKAIMARMNQGNKSADTQGDMNKVYGAKGSGVRVIIPEKYQNLKATTIEVVVGKGETEKNIDLPD